MHERDHGRADTCAADHAVAANEHIQQRTPGDTDGLSERGALDVSSERERKRGRGGNDHGRDDGIHDSWNRRIDHSRNDRHRRRAVRGRNSNRA
jgi:hypothetical protein